MADGEPGSAGEHVSPAALVPARQCRAAFGRNLARAHAFFVMRPCGQQALQTRIEHTHSTQRLKVSVSDDSFALDRQGRLRPRRV